METPRIEYSFYLSGFRRIFNKDFPYKRENTLFENPRFASLNEAVNAAKQRAEEIYQEELQKGNPFGLQGDIEIFLFANDRDSRILYIPFKSLDWKEELSLAA